MYQIQYSCWDPKNFPGFNDHLIQLEKSSKAFLNSKSIFPGKESRCIDSFLHNMEYYYASLYKNHLITGKSQKLVLEQLKKLSLIKVLPPENSRIYALAYKDHISLNPNISPINRLSKEETDLLIHSHELTHMINKRWLPEAAQYCNELYQDPIVKVILHNMGLDISSLKNGFDLVDEVIAQESAERTVYLRKGTSRPPKTVRRDNAIFLCQPYVSNYNLYGEFQEIGTRFARTLDFLHCTKEDSDEEVLRKLTIVAFEGNLVDCIKRELAMHPEKMDSFVILLATMGKVKDSSYSIFGLSKNKGSINVNPYLSPFNKLSAACQK